MIDAVKNSFVFVMYPVRIDDKVILYNSGTSYWVGGGLDMRAVLRRLAIKRCSRFK